MEDSDGKDEIQSSEEWKSFVDDMLIAYKHLTNINKEGSLASYEMDPQMLQYAKNEYRKQLL
ncbi:hypothetical protein CR513_56047, partial [Mucuna pruriens]